MTDTPASPLGAAWASRFTSPAGPPGSIAGVDLAAQLSARLCHDFVSPASAIVSGLDLLDDPTAADMRDDAMNLIATSARKLVDLLSFSRVAFGSSAAAETFDVRELEKLARGVFAHVRPDLAWEVEPAALPKGPARALLNLAQLGAGALPTGGIVTVRASLREGEVALSAQASGARARLRPEVVRGLKGEKLEGGLGGHWVQAYFLHQLVTSGGGVLEHKISDEAVLISARVRG